MTTGRVALLLLIAIVVAGCTRGPQETKESPDGSAYAGGAGIAVALTNAAEGTFQVTVVMLASESREVARMNATLASHDSAEKWYGLDARSHTLRMGYHWSSAAGRSASGSDEQVVDLRDCPALTRVAWEFRQQGDIVGSAYLGKTCITSD